MFDTCSTTTMTGLIDLLVISSLASWGVFPKEEEGHVDAGR